MNRNQLSIVNDEFAIFLRFVGSYQLDWLILKLENYLHNGKYNCEQII